MKEYVYSAFISYKHNPDEKMAATIQNQIEQYKVPRKLRSSALVDGNRMKKVFRDSTEFSGSHNLVQSIRDALSRSAFLIVIVSEETKNSPWVTQEIEFFLKEHDREHILTVLSNGKSPVDYYPEILVEVEIRDGVEKKADPLAVDYRKYDPDRGRRMKKANRRIYTNEFPRIIAPILGVSYDDLYKRQERYKRKRILTVGFAAILLLSAALIYFIWSRNRIDSNYREALEKQALVLAKDSMEALDHGDRVAAIDYALQALPNAKGNPEMPVTREAEYALSRAVDAYVVPGDPYHEVQIRKIALGNAVNDFVIDPTGRYLLCSDRKQNIKLFDVKTNTTLVDTKVSEGKLHNIVVCSGEFYLIISDQEGIKIRHLSKDGTITTKREISNSEVSSSQTAGLAVDDRIVLFRLNKDYDKNRALEIDEYWPGEERFESSQKPAYFERIDSVIYSESAEEFVFSCSFTDSEYGIGICRAEDKNPIYYSIGGERVDQFYTDGDRLYYCTGGPAILNISEHSMYYHDYTARITCMDKNTKNVIWQEEEKGSSYDPQTIHMKAYRQNGKDYVVTCVANGAHVYDAQSGRMVLECDYMDQALNIQAEDGLKVVLGNGKVSEIDPEEGTYTVSDSYNIDLIFAEAVHDSFMGKTVSFVVTPEYEVYIFCNGWGDASFSEILQRDSDIKIRAKAAGGTLAAICITEGDEDNGKLYLVDTKNDQVMWEKEMPFKAEEDDTELRFSDNGDRVIATKFTYYEKLEMAAFPVDGSEIEHTVITEEDLGGRFSGTVVFHTRETDGFLNLNKETVDDGAGEKREVEYLEMYTLGASGPERKRIRYPQETPDSNGLMNVDNGFVSEDGKHLVFIARTEGKVYDFVLYDLEKDTWHILKELSEESDYAYWKARAEFSERYLAVMNENENEIFLFGNENGELISGISRPGCLINSFSLHDDNSLYVFWADGIVERYDPGSGEKLAEIEIYTGYDTVYYSAWYYNENNVILWGKMDIQNWAYVLDKDSLKMTDRLSELVLYVPDTDTFIMSRENRKIGSFKRHSPDELVRMGEEHLGEEISQEEH